MCVEYDDVAIKIVDVQPVSRSLPTHVRRAILGVEKVPIGMEEIENWFTYHSPTEVDQVGYVAIRNAAKELAKVIVNHTPPSADQTAAIRKVREAVHAANSAIACGGK
jgi:hypothetical protein